MVTVEAVVVAPVILDAVEDEARIILDRPMQQGDVCVPTLAQMFLTAVRSLQQIKCARKSLCNMVAPTMEKTLTTNCRTRFLLFSSILCTPMMSWRDIV
jgi:hypothetical protein